MTAAGNDYFNLTIQMIPRLQVFGPRCDESVVLHVQVIAWLPQGLSGPDPWLNINVTRVHHQIAPMEQFTYFHTVAQDSIHMDYMAMRMASRHRAAVMSGRCSCCRHRH